MVWRRHRIEQAKMRLSVLALSSRFDGQEAQPTPPPAWPNFQYSLCRVVLMVNGCGCWGDGWCCFQYSLCRVVLMVEIRHQSREIQFILSVLALSSRFDGLPTACRLCHRL